MVRLSYIKQSVERKEGKGGGREGGREKWNGEENTTDP